MSEELIHHAHEQSHEIVSEEHEKKRSRFTKYVSLSTLIFAMIAAIGALLASISANESLFMRTGEIIELSRQETDRILAEVLTSRIDLLSIGGEVADEDRDRVADLRSEIDHLRDIRSREEGKVHRALDLHEIFAISVTILSFAITLCGMAVIVEQRKYWYVSLAFGMAGVVVFVIGIVQYLG